MTLHGTLPNKNTEIQSNTRNGTHVWPTFIAKTEKQMSELAKILHRTTKNLRWQARDLTKHALHRGRVASNTSQKGLASNTSRVSQSVVLAESTAQTPKRRMVIY